MPATMFTMAAYATLRRVIGRRQYKRQHCHENIGYDSVINIDTTKKAFRRSLHCRR